MRIDVTAASTLENYPQDICGQKPCVPLYQTSELTIQSNERYKDRFVIVDVVGETVVIDVAAPADKFDAFSPKAQEVLDSVEWKGGLALAYSEKNRETANRNLSQDEWRKFIEAEFDYVRTCSRLPAG